jgi:tetratricopeptide (TPR) repeat protein
MIICCCASGYCHAQSIDSFPIWKQELQDQLEPSQRQQLIDKISLEYEQVNKDSAIAYTKQALSLSQQRLDTPNQIFMLTRLGAGYRSSETRQHSIDYFTQALELAEATGDEKGISNILGFFASFYMEQTDYRKALEYEQMALDHFRKSKDTTGIDNIYSHLGALYFNLQEYSKALNYHLRALALIELDKFPAMINLYLGNIAATYNIMGQMENAAIFYQCQLEQAKELNDSLALALCYMSLGNFSLNQSKLNEARQYFESALFIYQKVESKSNEMWVYGGLSEVFLQLHQYDKALNYNARAMSLSKELNLQVINHQLWKDLSLLFEKTNQPLKALDAYKQYVEYRDSSMNLTKKSAFARQEIQYDFDKQAYADSLSHTNEMKVNHLKLQRQRTMTYSGLGGFILVLSMLTFLYRSYRQKQKSNRELAIAKDRAEQSEKFKQQFLANMSHEIRTPMNVVLGMTDLVLDTPLNPKQKNYLAGIKRASSNLLHIINDILDLSKVEAGKLELEKIDFSIREVVQQVHDLLNQKSD